MPGYLVAHAHFNIFPFPSLDAFCTKLVAKFPRQLAVAGEKSRFQHRGFREHVAVRFSDRFLNGTRGVPNLEAAVPKQIQNLIDHLLQVRRNRCRRLVMQKHNIDITKWIELAAAVSAKSYQRQWNLRLAISASSSGRAAEDVSQ